MNVMAASRILTPASVSKILMSPWAPAQVHIVAPCSIAGSNTTKNLTADQGSLFHAPRDH